MSAPCLHSTVATTVAADGQCEWACIDCTLTFVPITALREVADDFDTKMGLALEVSAQTAAYILKSVMGPVRPSEGADAVPQKTVVANTVDKPDEPHGPFFFGQAAL